MKITKTLATLAISTLLFSNTYATSVETEVNNLKASTNVWSFGYIIKTIFNEFWKITWNYLDLDSSIEPSDTNNDVPSSKAVQDLFDTWIDTLWNTSGPNRIYYNSWSVGIGTDLPTSNDLLTVKWWQIGIENDSGDTALVLRSWWDAKGQIRYNETADIFTFW